MPKIVITSTGKVDLEYTEEDNILKSNELQKLDMKAKKYGFPTIDVLESMNKKDYLDYVTNQGFRRDIHPELLLKKLVNTHEKAMELGRREINETDISTGNLESN